MAKFKGIYFLPGKENDHCTGELNCDYSENIELEIIGALEEDMFNEITKYDIIHGFSSSGKKITLIGCYLSSRGFSIPGIEIQKFTSQYALVGAYFTSLKEVTFGKVRISIFEIEDWFDFKPITNDINIETGDITYKYHSPKNILIPINEWLSLEVENEYKAPLAKRLNMISLELRITLRFSYTDAKTIEQIYSDIYCIRMFFSLVMMKENIISKISLYTKTVKIGGKDHEEWIELYTYCNWNKEHIVKKTRIPTMDYLVPYDEIKDDFPIILANWYHEYVRLSPVIDKYNKIINLPKQTIESTFMDMIQAIEAYHRRCKNNEIIKKELYFSKLDLILQKVDEDDRAWIKEKMAFGYEPTLADRLNDLINYDKYPFLSSIIADKNKYVTNIKNTRNYYTHFDERLSSKKLEYNEMYHVTEFLEIFLVFLLLEQCGVSIDKIIGSVIRKC